MNKFRPHIFVLPEDLANIYLANGFQLELYTRQFQILPPAGGWLEVLHRFEADHISEMERYRDRLMVLLIDFDGRPERLQHAHSKIPEHLSARVFVLGALHEPQDLKELGNYEKIGRSMARDCRDETTLIWGHEQLRHNAVELQRMTNVVRPILFNG